MDKGKLEKQLAGQRAKLERQVKRLVNRWSPWALRAQLNTMISINAVVSEQYLSLHRERRNRQRLETRTEYATWGNQEDHSLRELAIGQCLRELAAKMAQGQEVRVEVPGERLRVAEVSLELAGPVVCVDKPLEDGRC